jgi:iron complex outermembrane receptor protein
MVPSAGIDYLSYPRSKAVALGLNVTFKIINDETII